MLLQGGQEPQKYE
jgi:serine/threonine protein phosphatase PrpC